MSTKEDQPTSTADKILLAARKLFVEHGFAGTSMGKIASEAGVNHSLLFHHFGNKQKLWIAVKQNIVSQNNDNERLLPTTDQPFIDFMRTLFIRKIAFYRQNPDVIRMLNWQRLEYDTEKEIGLCMSTEAKAWIDALRYYQQQGSIHPEFKPEFILTFILSLISSAALDPNVFIEGKDKALYIEFCVQRVVAALK